MAQRIITVVGGDLFRVAAVHLRDATQATRIAALNGLTDFNLTGQVTLKLPPVDETATGGIPAL